MGFVELTPAGPDLVLLADLACRRRAAEFHECRVRAVAEIQEVGVDPPKLPHSTDPG
jgi:hypothetical protein